MIKDESEVLTAVKIMAVIEYSVKFIMFRFMFPPVIIDYLNVLIILFF